MAWNQPGGNGSQDPWNNRGGQQGPPDLDEVLKKLQAQLQGIFGKSGGGGGGRSLGSLGNIGLGVLLAAALVVWGLAGFYIVDPAEEAVVLRFGQYTRTEQSGLNWVPRFIESYQKVNVGENRSEQIGFRIQGSGKSAVPNEALMLTKDENIIDIGFTVQYRVRDSAEYLFNVRDPRTTLRQATESAVREIVGRSRMDFVITEGRSAVATEVEQLTQDILNIYGTGLKIIGVNMQDAQPPAQVQDAFADAIKAREDQERIINEANAYKADVVPKARGEAAAIREQAAAYKARVTAQANGDTDRFLQVLTEYRKAPEITRERLYIEAVESVMANSSKVLVDVPGGNNLMYLPLDRLIGERNRSTATRQDGQFNDTGPGSQATGAGNNGRGRNTSGGRNRQ